MVFSYDYSNQNRRRWWQTNATPSRAISMAMAMHRCRCGASLCGAKSNVFNLILRLFCGTCLHTNQTRWHICTNNRQTPPPWWSRSPLQQHGFGEPMPPEGWAALRMFISMLPSKQLSRFHKFK